MILNHQTFELLRKVVFEKVEFIPPLQKIASMEGEACLIYTVKGNSEIYGGIEKDHMNSGESVLLKCGHYINNWLVSDKDESHEGIAFHFYPEVLKLIYENSLPEFLKTPNQCSSKRIQKIPSHEVIHSFVNSLDLYFNHPDLFTEETIKLKLKELLSLLHSIDRPGVQEILSGIFDPVELDFKKVISSHLYSDLSIEDFALL